MHYLQENQSKTGTSRWRVGKATARRIKSLTCFALVFIIMLSYICMPANAASNGYVSINKGSYGMDQELQTLINQCREKKATAHQMAECARNLGYAEDHVIIKTAQQVWAEQDKLQAEYSAELKAYNEKLSKWRT